MMNTQLLKKAILDAIDNGNRPTCTSDFYPWEFYEGTPLINPAIDINLSEAEANTNRLDFVDAVVERYHYLERVKLAEEGN